MRTATLRGLVLALIAVAAPAPASADPSTPFETDGPCREAIIFVPVDSEVARPHVPPGLTLAEAGGNALLGVFSGACQISVDEGPRTATVLGGVSLTTDASSSQGCGSYDPYWTADTRGAYLRAHRRVGWPMALDEDGRFGVTGTGPAAVVTAHNRNDIGSWDLSLAGPAGAELPQQLPFQTVHCTAGPRGLVKGDFDHDFDVATPMLGTLEVEPGTLLWTLVGEREAVTAPGLFFEFEYDSTTAVVQGRDETEER
jgi:hypothetical protein